MKDDNGDASYLILKGKKQGFPLVSRNWRMRLALCLTIIKEELGPEQKSRYMVTHARGEARLDKRTGDYLHGKSPLGYFGQGAGRNSGEIFASLPKDVSGGSPLLIQISRQGLSKPSNRRRRMGILPEYLFGCPFPSLPWRSAPGTPLWVKALYLKQITSQLHHSNSIIQSSHNCYLL